MRKPLRAAQKRIEDARQAWFQRRMRRRGNVLEPGCRVPRGSEIGARIRVGRETRIAGSIVIMGGGRVSLGRWCLLGRGVRIFTSNHRIDTAAVQDRIRVGHDNPQPQPISIGNGAWIGDAAIVLAGVEIGDGAVVGAGAVVTRDVAPFAIVVGSPAREIRKRFSDQVIRELEQIAWWDWSLEEIRAQPRLFAADLTQSRVSDHYPLPRAALRQAR